jgi:hypothetical protein
MNIIWTLSFIYSFQIVNVEIEVAFNFIYTMHHNGLVSFFHISSIIRVEPFTFNMLKILFTNCILHLL